MINALYSHTYQCRVYVEDTDMFGIVYHANYLCYLERARTEWLRHSGISLYDLNNKGYWFVVANINIDYLLPARLDEDLIITTEVTKKKTHLAYFSQEIKHQNGEKCATAVVKVVGLNKEKKLCHIDKLLVIGSKNNGE